MKRDRLEQFVFENKEAFDTQVPPSTLWDRVSEELDEGKHKKVRRLMFLRVAAIGVVLLCAGLLIGIQIAGNADAMSPRLEEFAKAEHYYKNEFNAKLIEFQQMGVETRSVEQDLQQLDEVYNELKAELTQNQNLNTDKVVNAMIKNYRTKIDILETVLTRTKQKQNLSNLKIEENELDEI